MTKDERYGNLLFAHEKLVVVVSQGNGRECPGTVEAGTKQEETETHVSWNADYERKLRHEPVSVAAAESVSTRESDDFLVVEAHTVEYLKNKC